MNRQQSPQRHCFQSRKDTRSMMGRRGHNRPFMLSGSAVEKTRAALWLQVETSASPGGIPRCLRSATANPLLSFFFSSVFLELARGEFTVAQGAPKVIKSKSWVWKVAQQRSNFQRCVVSASEQNSRVSSQPDQSNKVHKRCIITTGLRACVHSHFNITQLCFWERSEILMALRVENINKFNLSVQSCDPRLDAAAK